MRLKRGGRRRSRRRCACRVRQPGQAWAELERVRARSSRRLVGWWCPGRRERVAGRLGPSPPSSWRAAPAPPTLLPGPPPRALCRSRGALHAQAKRGRGCSLSPRQSAAPLLAAAQFVSLRFLSSPYLALGRQRGRRHGRPPASGGRGQAGGGRGGGGGPHGEEGRGGESREERERDEKKRVKSVKPHTARRPALGRARSRTLTLTHTRASQPVRLPPPCRLSRRRARTRSLCLYPTSALAAKTHTPCAFDGLALPELARLAPPGRRQPRFQAVSGGGEAWGGRKRAGACEDASPLRFPSSNPAPRIFSSSLSRLHPPSRLSLS